MSDMLLPFLLEADTRRIDSAGEQTGVLKSWMLADNDETQRTDRCLNRRRRRRGRTTSHPQSVVAHVRAALRP